MGAEMLSWMGQYLQHVLKLKKGEMWIWKLRIWSFSI